MNPSLARRCVALVNADTIQIESDDPEPDCVQPSPLSNHLCARSLFAPFAPMSATRTPELQC